MFKTFLKGMYYVPTDNEDPYYILKNANKNRLNFIIIEYTNRDLFNNLNNDDKQISKLFYIQDKINSFEKKYRTTVGILCFKCRSIIGTVKILLSKSIFRGEIFKLQNFYLWCYLNNPTLILSNNNLSHIKNSNIKYFFKLYSDNFLKSSDNYINLLKDGMKLTPICTENGFIFIRNPNNSIFDFIKLKQHIYSEIKNGNFYTSNTDRLYFDFNATITKNNFLKGQIRINSDYLSNQKLSLINEKNEVLKTQSFYDLHRVNYDFEIKNNANNFIIFRITCKNDLFALTKPFYLNK